MRRKDPEIPVESHYADLRYKIGLTSLLLRAHRYARGWKWNGRFIPLFNYYLSVFHRKIVAKTGKMYQKYNGPLCLLQKPKSKTLV